MEQPFCLILIVGTISCKPLNLGNGEESRNLVFIYIQMNWHEFLRFRINRKN